MGAGGEDVRLSPLARASVPLSIECKCQERLNVYACLEQAVSNCPSGATPCVVFTRNRAATHAVVPWDFLLALLKKQTCGEGMDPRLQKLLHDLATYLATTTAASLPAESDASASASAPEESAAV